MQTYPLIHTSLPPVTRLAYGCMKIAASWDGSPVTPENRKAAFAAIEAALEAGINFYDHADIYCRGRSEEVFGDYLREHPGLREKLVIQSKVGILFPNQPEPGLPGRYNFSKEHILWTVDQELGRLGSGYLDILLLHRPDCLVEPEEVAAAFDELQASGKVRAFGVSNHSAHQIQLLRKYVRQPLVVNQLEVSLLHHGLLSDGFLNNVPGNLASGTTGLLEYCRLHDIRIQAWGPVRGGKLFKAGAELSENEVAAKDLLEKLGAQYGTGAETIMLAWLLRHPAGIQPLIGSCNPERIKAQAAADSITLSREEWYALLAAVRGRQVP